MDILKKVLQKDKEPLMLKCRLNAFNFEQEIPLDKSAKIKD